MHFKSKYIPILMAATLAIGVLLGSLLMQPRDQILSNASTSKSKLNKLIDFIDNEYVDSVNTDSIVDLTVDKILSQLDPHSVYIPSDQLAEVSENMKGDFVGIGVNYYMHNDTLAVIYPVANGPSEKAGVLAGDRILYAGKSKLFGRKLPTDSLMTKLKGIKGSELELTIYRKSLGKQLKVKLKRDVIPIKSVDVALLLKPQIGYIKINRFAETTFDEFKKGLQKLQKQKLETLVLDLRDNSGGYMEEAIGIADEFLQKKELIVVTKYKSGNQEKAYATSEGRFQKGALYVLIDENSASASEILAGAIQDNDRGMVFGRRSFGKGLVQREIDFNDGSAVRLTIARYYTPAGRSIQKPYSKGKEKYLRESDLRHTNGELYTRDSIKVNDSLKFKTKKGRTVYGGGGIVPDVFVPSEVANGSEHIGYLLQTGIIGRFAFEELDRNRKVFEGLSFSEFQNKIKGEELYVKDFEKYLASAGVVLSLEKNKKLINKFIIAELARQLYGDEAYFKMTLSDDPMIQSVLKYDAAHQTVVNKKVTAKP